MRKTLLFLLLFCPFLTLAQSNNAPSSYDLHDIKITGYLQTQFQKAQSGGITSFSGGDFSANSDSRFMIRRGRLKIDRVDKFSNIVFQIDATQNGVNLMDAFIQLHTPEIPELMLTAGLFNRPFGYSIVYSSGYRDFPERARVFQTLMPRERDLGAMLSFNSKKIAKFLTADVALVNGSGLSARDYDSRKDIVASLNFKFDSLANKHLHIGFGASIYKGTVRSNTDTYYTANGNGFVANTKPDNVNKNLNRDYYGANLQVQYDNTFGTTTFKTEYVEGTQPGVANSTSLAGPYASQSFATQPLTNLYLRHFNGYYFWLTQQIAKSRFTALLAYDVYDPNTDVKENTIGLAGNNTTGGDIKYATLGYGITCAVNARLKFTVYNEHVSNDGTTLTAYQSDLKDNVFTTRLQYRW
ncbi:porin [Pedobacter sp. LMG 31464]|uniref:Porin n=1 Tax=Pedobacter planticolens TaxID=2679964 RepID=A0A923DZL5_9SPHI|nr:porin [Pedobacter planticolens]MBB2147021.1 porin [Pedobacter planticolens]